MKVCVIELNKFHTEVFPVYENLLPAIFPDREIDIHYFVVPRKYQELKHIYGDRLHAAYDAGVYFLCSKTGLRGIYFKSSVKRIIGQHHPDLVIFNSIVPERTRDAFESITDRMKFGIVHGFGRVLPRKMKNSFYFVLGEEIYQKYREQNIDGYMQPLFPQFKLEKVRNEDKTIIAVQGTISFKRRDYPLLVRTARELKARQQAGVLFNIVGSMSHRDAPALLRLVRRHHVEDYFQFHEALSDEQFYREVISSDYLMPLLGERQKKYLSHDTITSTHSHSISYNKPMILSADNAMAWGMDSSTALIYKSHRELTELITGLPDKEAYNSLCSALKNLKNQKEEKNRKFLKEMSWAKGLFQAFRD